MRVFITGASSGIGAALARHYARTGATLGLVARRAAMLESVLKDLPAPARGNHLVFPVDVNDHLALAQAAKTFIEQAGVPDIVIASAGISAGTVSGNTEDLAVFRRILETNVLATVATFSPFIAAMREVPGARLVGIASVAGIRGLPGAEAYSASKAAVISYCESLRVYLRDSSIRVVTIAPGYIATPMTEHNPYRMPFLMPANVFAHKASRAIERGSSYCVIPWQMGVIAKLLRLLPNSVFDAAFARAPHKPRLRD